MPSRSFLSDIRRAYLFPHDEVCQPQLIGLLLLLLDHLVTSFFKEGPCRQAHFRGDFVNLIFPGNSFHLGKQESRDTLSLPCLMNKQGMQVTFVVHGRITDQLPLLIQSPNETVLRQ